MNKFDDRYEIRLANYTDIDAIMNFIGTVWKKDHILSRDREYFEYEFADEDHVNFIIAVSRETEEIEAILGFLKSSRDVRRKDIWGSFWKVNDAHDNDKMLGIELERRVKDLTDCRYHNGIGINPHTAVPLVRLFLGNTVKKMNHYYMLNPSLAEYKVAIINADTPHVAGLQEGYIYRISDFSEIREQFEFDPHQIPYKDGWYVEKKFFCNPKREYQVYGIKNNGTDHVLKAFFVTRECEANGSRILRILDYYGDREAFAGIGRNIEELMIRNAYEYVDFYNYGFEDAYLKQAGFVRRNEEDANIIPNYFEPLVRENVDIWIHYEIDGTLFYKADGDQDRANM